MDSLRGKLLIAAPSLFDFFRRAVVLVIEHSEEGTMGVILNRPSETTIGEAAPPLTGIADPDQPVHVGGPVGTGSLVVLGELSDPSAASKQVLGPVGVVDPEGDAEVLRVRVFAGHAGWAPGQLEAELEAEAWTVEEAEPDHVFSDEDLWACILQRRGGQWRLLATMPEDPSLN